MSLPSKLASTVQGSRKVQTYQYGLQTLLPTSDEIPKRSVHGGSVVQSKKLLSLSSKTLSIPSSSSSSPMVVYIDDLIGSDSGVCLSSKEEQEMIWSNVAAEHSKVAHGKKKKEKCAATTTKDHPLPLLPSMACTQKRRYEDGKLIIIEEKVKNREFLESHRENGRFILKLVTLEDPDCLAGYEKGGKEVLFAEGNVEKIEDSKASIESIEDGQSGEEKDDHDNDDEEKKGKPEENSVTKTYISVEHPTESQQQNFFYQEVIASNSELCPNADGREEIHDTCFTQPGSAPFSSFARPIATAM